MKKFLIKSFLISTSLIVLLISVNYFIDPAKIYDSDYEKKISNILINGNFVTNIDNYDERILQKELIHLMKSSPEVLVFGSSRTMLINSSFFPKQTFFNNSVSGASLEDFIALFEIYKENNLLPKKIVIGVDPWLFNENNRQVRWKSIEYYYMKNKGLTTHSFPFQKIRQLVSLSYFQSAVDYLPEYFLNKTEPKITNRTHNLKNTKLTDGSLVYNSNYRNASLNIVNSKINRFMDDKIYSIENFSSISDEIWFEFIMFVNSLMNSNISIEFFMSPYPPKVYDKISNEYPNVLKTERLILKYAKKNNIKIYGSFNPENLEFDNSYFYDGMHCNEKGIKQILNN